MEKKTIFLSLLPPEIGDFLRNWPGDVTGAFLEKLLNVEHRLNRMIRLAALPDFVGLKRTQIHQLIEAGEFPKAISLSDKGRAKAWLEAEIISWQQARLAKRAQG